VRLGPLDIDQHGLAAIALTREAFVESFGSSDRFDAELGADGSGAVPGLRVFERPLHEDVSG
jgi:hypothetical protein